MWSDTVTIVSARTPSWAATPYRPAASISTPRMPYFSITSNIAVSGV